MIKRHGIKYSVKRYATLEKALLEYQMIYLKL